MSILSTTNTGVSQYIHVQGFGDYAHKIALIMYDKFMETYNNPVTTDDGKPLNYIKSQKGNVFLIAYHNVEICAEIKYKIKGNTLFPDEVYSEEKHYDLRYGLEIWDGWMKKPKEDTLKAIEENLRSYTHRYLKTKLEDEKKNFLHREIIPDQCIYSMEEHGWKHFQNSMYNGDLV